MFLKIFKNKNSHTPQIREVQMKILKKIPLNYKK